jgi:hypothetical protein
MPPQRPQGTAVNCIQDHGNARNIVYRPCDKSNFLCQKWRKSREIGLGRIIRPRARSGAVRLQPKSPEFGLSPSRHPNSGEFGYEDLNNPG